MHGRLQGHKLKLAPLSLKMFCSMFSPDSLRAVFDLAIGNAYPNFRSIGRILHFVRKCSFSKNLRSIRCALVSIQNENSITPLKNVLLNVKS